MAFPQQHLFSIYLNFGKLKSVNLSLLKYTTMNILSQLNKARIALKRKFDETSQKSYELTIVK